MSLDIWPPVAPGELKIKVAEAQVGNTLSDGATKLAQIDCDRSKTGGKNNADILQETRAGMDRREDLEGL
jgi:hypothetical protein